MGSGREGLATAVALAGGAGAADADGQFDLLEPVGDLPISARPLPAKSGPQGGRPAGSRNRSTDEWRRWFLARYASPLMGLGEIYSRTPAELARELKLYKRVVVVREVDGRLVREEAEDEGQLDLERAFAIQLEAMQAALPYVHQRQPLAIESKGEQRGILLIGDLAVGGGVMGDGLPLADDEQNQQVIDGASVRLKDGQSDDNIKPLNEKDNADGDVR